MPDASGRFETFVTLILKDAYPALAEAHDELYPERIPENIPLTLTLLYPFAPRAELDDYLPRAREFFASRAPFSFDIVRPAQWPGGGAVFTARFPA